MSAAVKVREIATKLSVSPATVSRTLNGNYGRGVVSLATARRILNYCFRQGYISKHEKDSILTKIHIRVTDKKVFCLSCFEGLWNYNAIFSSVSSSLQDQGRYSGFFTVRSGDDLRRFPYDEASVILVFGRIMPETYEALSKSGIPIVLGDNNIPESKWSTVNSDNLGATSRAVEILAALGHRRIAFMCRHEDFPQRTYNLHHRQNGYIVGMTNAGLSYDGLIVAKDCSRNDYTPSTHEEVLADLRQLAECVINLNPMPTAVVAANDLIAHVLRMVLRERGLRVPEDVSLIGYDGQHRIPGIMGFEPISTMVVDWKEMGRAMVDVAMELVLNPKIQTRHILIPAEYEDMGTVATLPVRNSNVLCEKNEK
jgi:DNA-binding LacI/PurR family transcriptional regulator